ncbi:MAG TPA: hypothetical protein DDY70_03215 [Clostridiales bacterium]|nr:hypothetical protein [Clostridiales bacterium]
MKFSKIETQGITSLVFSLATLPKDPADLSKTLANDETLGADAVLFLTPTLAADVCLHSYDKRGEKCLSHEILHALAAYLFYVAGLPVYEYEAETEEGILPVRITAGISPTFTAKYGKCKQTATNIPFRAKNIEATVDEVRCHRTQYAILFAEHAESVDLPALARALRTAPACGAETVVALSEFSDASGSAYLLRAASLRGDTVFPSAAAGAALMSLIAKGRERYGRDVTFRHEGGSLVCRMEHGGTFTVRADARLLLRGELTPPTPEPNE